MKMKYKEIYLSLILGVVLPGVVFTMLQRRQQREVMQQKSTSQSVETSTDSNERIFSLSVQFDDGSVQQMDLDKYLLCVLLAEMPAEFEMDALKAQAVVARTYTLRRFETGGKHEKAAVCTDHTCCQAYCAQDDFLARGESKEMLDKVRSAVLETTGEVLTYNGDLIEATYFSCSGGRTEAAVAVWGAEIPYLQAVDSPGEEGASHYMDTVSFSLNEFSDLIGETLTGDWLGEIIYTDGGGVETIEIGDEIYKGTTLRQTLGLRSTAFVITAVGDTVTITTKGFGHRVGMSQYGAEAMAVLGHNYKEILEYYYKGTTLEQYRNV